MADILEFQPKSRSGDPDFPGIPELAAFHEDGGKARIKRRRCVIGLDHMFHGSTVVDDLTMDHADPEAYVAPDTDCA